MEDFYLQDCFLDQKNARLPEDAALHHRDPIRLSNYLRQNIPDW
jgi:hypothetical protein